MLFRSELEYKELVNDRNYFYEGGIFRSNFSPAENGYVFYAGAIALVNTKDLEDGTQRL